MHKKLLFLLTILPIWSNAQEFKRKNFEYNPTKIDTISDCTATVNGKLDEAYNALEQNKSSDALSILQSLSPGSTDCPEYYEVKGFSIFRNGDWLKGIETIEKGIDLYGSQPELIKRKAEMSLEMGELGVNQKVIDGKVEYKSTPNYNFDNEQFKTENYKSALVDLTYLAENFNIDEDHFYIAKIHQILKNYEESNKILKRLVEHPTIGNDARFNLTDNLIQLNQLDEAEKEIKKLLEKFPEATILQDVLSNIEQKKNNKS